MAKSSPRPAASVPPAGFNIPAGLPVAVDTQQAEREYDRANLKPVIKRAAGSVLLRLIPFYKCINGTFVPTFVLNRKTYFGVPDPSAPGNQKKALSLFDRTELGIVPCPVQVIRDNLAADGNAADLLAHIPKESDDQWAFVGYHPEIDGSPLQVLKLRAKEYKQLYAACSDKRLGAPYDIDKGFSLGLTWTPNGKKFNGSDVLELSVTSYGNQAGPVREDIRERLAGLNVYDLPGIDANAGVDNLCKMYGLGDPAQFYVPGATKTAFDGDND